MLQSAIDTSLVRLAEPIDADDLVQMTRELHLESGLRDGKNLPLPFSEDKVRRMMEQTLTPNNGALVGVIGHPGNIQGSVCLEICETWYSSEEVIRERWNFVRPAFRQSHNAKILIAFSKAVATVMRLPLVMGTMSTERQPAKIRFYQRTLGVEPLGAYFVFNFDKAEG